MGVKLSDAIVKTSIKIEGVVYPQYQVWTKGKSRCVKAFDTLEEAEKFLKEESNG